MCFVSAASDPILSQSTDQFRSILIAILIASFGISAIKYLSGGMFDTLGRCSCKCSLVLGAFLYSVLAWNLQVVAVPACLFEWGEGYSVHFITFIFSNFGYTLGNTHYDQLWAPLVQQSPLYSSPERFAGDLVSVFILQF